MVDPKKESLNLITEGLLKMISTLIDERMKDAIPQRTIISVREAAKRYDVHKSTIYDWFAQGVVRKHSIGGRVYCFIEDFEGIKSRMRR